MLRPSASHRPRSESSLSSETAPRTLSTTVARQHLAAVDLRLAFKRLCPFSALLHPAKKLLMWAQITLLCMTQSCHCSPTEFVKNHDSSVKALFQKVYVNVSKNFTFAFRTRLAHSHILYNEQLFLCWSMESSFIENLYDDDGVMGM